MKCARLRCAMGLLAVSSWCSLLLAQPEPAEETETCEQAPEVCGRVAFERGVAAYKERNFKQAQAHFQEALAYKWHPAIAMNLALSLKEDGQLLAAIQILEQILQQEDTKEAVAKAAERHQRLAEEQLAEIEIIKASDEPLEITIDGRPMQPDAQGLIRVDPDTHQVEVSLGDHPATQRQITLAPAERVRLHISPTREIVLSVPTPSAVSTTEPVPPPAEEKPAVVHAPDGLSPGYFYASAGITALLGGVTIWSALNTKSAFDDYERSLPGLSQSEVNQRVTRGHAKETRTNVLLGVTAGAAATTAVLGIFFTHWEDTTPSPSVRTAPGGAAMHLRGVF